MDAIFTLAPEQRARVLERTAARIPGCLYLFLWAPLVASPLIRSSHLFCLDAWIGGAGGGRVRAAFEAYRGSLCAVVSGCVPGWAYVDGRAYMELPEPDLTASASLQVQQELYHMAVFMGCDGGEMEVGLASSDTSPRAATAVADHVQQAMLEELMQMTSSSSSSMPSLSIGSPEYSSLIRSMTTTSTATEPSSSSHVRPMQPAVQLPGLLMPPVYGYGGHAPQFVPSSDADDAAMAQAMLAVIASSSSSSAPPPPPMTAPPPWLARHRAQAHQQRSSSPRRGRAGAFKAYSAALSPRARRRPGAPGQRMVKTAIALMVSVHVAMRDRELARQQHEDVVAAAQAQPPPAQPTSSQVHHMISERRRRERLNESFQTLRALLPPRSKKDKATVLAHTTEYMNKLIAEVSDLEEKNRRLEAQLGLSSTRQAASDDDSSETTTVQVGASTSEQLAREVGIRVRVRAECDLSELVIAVLARIREMGRFVVATVDAEERGSGHARVRITLRATAGDDELIDETSLKEAMAKVVEDTVARPPSPPHPHP
ncbi:hypothetical protein QOZ80_6BG0496630 [Eleusine coracana subsp. coracana]|nr:hypothetical protein QOZ80_6BG0496630 [Eleusine coracana subsp. coracana]